MQTLQLLENALNKQDTTTEAKLRYEAYQRDSLKKQESNILASSKPGKKPKNNPIYSL